MKTDNVDEPNLSEMAAIGFLVLHQLYDSQMTYCGLTPSTRLAVNPCEARECEDVVESWLGRS